MYLVTLDWLTASHHTHEQYTDDDGTAWICTEVEGWQSAPGRRTKHTERPTADGSHRSAAYRDTRSYVVKGNYFPPSPEHGYDLADRIPALMPDPGERYPLTVQGPNGRTLTAYVEQSGSEILVAQVGPHKWEYSVPTVAADPYRYEQGWSSAQTPPYSEGVGGINFGGSGASFSSPGLNMGTAPADAVVDVVGTGTTESLVVFQIVGPTSGVLVEDVDSPRQIIVRGEIPEGASMFVNASPRIAFDVPDAMAPLPANGALLGMANARGALGIPAGWPTLLPGQTRRFRMTGQAGSGSSLIVHTRGSWV